jgi:hypothetical protein
VGDPDAHTTFWVRWEDAERLAPHALGEEAGYYPPRWRVSGWPEGEELERLREAGTDTPGA